MTVTPWWEADSQALVDAGGILPEGSPPIGGELTDILTTREYRHPALDDRVVVRLVPGTLGEAEDLSMGFFQFHRVGEPEEVGTVRSRVLGFPDWALANDPANGHHALALVKKIERLARLARTRANLARDGFIGHGEELARSLPHFLPTYYEEAGRAFLAAGNASYAATMFGRAREAEASYGLDIDVERQHAVFLEFALAGALTAKALSGYARDLALRTEPEEAYRRFHRLCVDRCLGGVPPYASMHTDLRRVAKAAGMGRAEADDLVIGELVHAPALAQAPEAFWRAYLAAIIKLARSDPRARSSLLGVMPERLSGAQWLAVLDECGATAALTGPAETPEAEGGSPDGPAGWLARLLGRYARHWTDLSSLLTLIERMAPRLIAGGTPVSLAGSYQRIDLDVADQCLSLGIPVTISDQARIELGDWLASQRDCQRDLVSLASHSGLSERLPDEVGRLVRFADARQGGADRTEGLSILRQILAVPGLRPAARRWMARVASRIAHSGIAGLARACDQLAPLAIREAVEANPEAVDLIAGHDLAGDLGRTLRSGLLAEYTWPAYEEAMERLEELPGDDSITITQQWPHLVLTSGDLNLVVGPDRIELEHHARRPDGPWTNSWYCPRRYVDGQLLVAWYADGDYQAYWSGTPDDVFSIEPRSLKRPLAGDESLPAPGAGRTSGGRPLSCGDRSEQVVGRVLSDRSTYWVEDGEEGRRVWREYDPATGVTGRISLPGFLEAGPGESPGLDPTGCSLRPVPESVGDSPLGQAGGLVGWRASRPEGGTSAGRGIDGRSLAVTSEEARRGPLLGAMRFPESDTLFGLMRAAQAAGGEVVVISSDGFPVGRHPVGHLVPPLDFWHFLRPRDMPGSRALRAVTDELAGRLLRGAVEVLDASGSDPATPAETPAEENRGLVEGLVREALGSVTTPALVSAVAETALAAAAGAVRLREFGSRVSAVRRDSRSPDVVDPLVDLPVQGFEAAVSRALEGLACPFRVSNPAHLRSLLAALVGDRRNRHLDLSLCGLNALEMLGVLPALMVRAASRVTPPDVRKTLLILLETFADSGLCRVGAVGRTVEVIASDREAGPGTCGQDGPNGGDVIEMDGRSMIVRARWERDGALALTLTEYSPTARFRAIDGYSIVSENVMVPCAIDQEDLRTLVDLARERGTYQTSGEDAERFSQMAGVSRAEALMALAGMPTQSLWRDPQNTTIREDLGLRPAVAEHGIRRWTRLGWQSCADLLGGALPRPLELLWTQGPDLEALASAWTEAHGRRTPVSDELIAEVAKAKIVDDPSEYLHGLGSPSECGWLAGAADHTGPETTEVFWRLSVLVPWLAYTLPAGDPIRRALPEVVERMVGRLLAPETLLVVGQVYPYSADALVETIHGTAAGPIQISPQRGISQVSMRPSGVISLDGPGISLLNQHLTRPLDRLLSRLRPWVDGSMAALVGSAADLAGQPAGYRHDPLVSAPDLVETVAAGTGLGMDAAAVYLQILALPDPTDSRVARWTGWKPARLRAARAELAATDLVVTARRARAGRSLFLPGRWLALAGPALPIEGWKLPLITGGESGISEMGAAIPTATVPRLFHLAWDRVTAGDSPQFDDLVTERLR